MASNDLSTPAAPGPKPPALDAPSASPPAQPAPPAPPAQRVEEDRATHERVLALLRKHDAQFSTLEHAPTRTSQESADVRGVPLASGAKAMLLRAGKQPLPGGGEFALVVLSAAAKLELGKLKKLLGVKDLSMASEADVLRLTGCVPGAVPPFACLFDGVLLVVDESLARQGEAINCNAGLRTSSVCGLSTAAYFAIEAGCKRGEFSSPL
jgi:Ala-tRNA(Pro) deacylase